MSSPPTIVALGGGGFLASQAGSRPGPLIDFIVSLNGTAAPRICRLGTATGDRADATASFYGAFAGTEVRASHLDLFPMPNHLDMRRHLLAQDAIWVGGGSVANLLAVWRTHGVDEVMREAWQAGVVLSGVSAGSLCWFEGGTTDSFGLDLRPVTNGLGFLPMSNCPHYDGEPQRRPTYQRLVAEGVIGPGLAADDGVGLHFEGTAFVGAVSDRPGAQAWRVKPDGRGGVTETAIAPRLLS